MQGRVINATSSNLTTGKLSANDEQLTTLQRPENEVSEGRFNNSGAKVQVKGARKIWGTMAESTVRSVKNVITRFCNVAPSRLNVKRKNRVMSDINKSVWWYIIHADEKVLSDLESKWDCN